MKVIYETPEINLIVEVEDVITTSNGLNQGEEWNQNDVGDCGEIFG